MAGTTSTTPGSGFIPPTNTSWADPLQLAAYRLVTRLATPAAGLILGVRERKGKEDPARRSERLGVASCTRPSGVVAWVHAASVGESAAVLPVVTRLIECRPDLSVLLTTGTVTSARYVASRLPVRTLHQFVPLDSPALVSRFLDQWKPSVAVLTEQEIWPNLVIETSRRGIPLALVNGRMSDRSYERWRRRSSVAKALYSRFAIVLAQNVTLAQRFSDLGAPRVIAVGNLKIDAPPPRVDPTALAALNNALAERPRLVAASTHEGEEEIVAEAHRLLARSQPGFCTIIAPRHPDRGAAVAASLAASGFATARRSQGYLPGRETAIYIADTIGELGTLYAATQIAFVGGSLVPHGGQNPIEAIRHGAVVVTGPSRHNFADVYGALLDAGGALEATAAGDLAEKVASLIGSPDDLAAIKARATAAVNALAGALDRSVSEILPLLPSATAVQGQQRAI